MTTIDDYRVREIREAVMVGGGWTSRVEETVCRCLDDAFESGLSSLHHGRARFRLVRWIATHQGQPDWTHKMIGEMCAMERETVSRNLTQLRSQSFVTGGRESGYELTSAGLEYAATYDEEPLADPIGASGRPQDAVAGS